MKKETLRMISMPIIALLLSVSVPIASAQSSVDVRETGTLVAIARTANLVVLAADSKITGPGTEQKYALIGESAACVIEGYEGRRSRDIDISSRLKAWDLNNPKADLRARFPDLLQVVAKAWDDAGFTYPFPKDRQPSDPITFLLCAGLADGSTFIMRGHTSMAIDSSATAQIDVPIGSDTFYVGGVFSDNDLSDWLRMPEAFIGIPAQNSADQVDKAFVKDLITHKAALSTLDFWATQTSGDESKSSPSSQLASWNPSSLANMLQTLYSVVEDHYSDAVGPPNIAVIIDPCGRSVTTVEVWNPVTVCKAKLRHFPWQRRHSSARQ